MDSVRLGISGHYLDGCSPGLKMGLPDAYERSYNTRGQILPMGMGLKEVLENRGRKALM